MNALNRQCYYILGGGRRELGIVRNEAEKISSMKFERSKRIDKKISVEIRKELGV